MIERFSEGAYLLATKIAQVQTPTGNSGGPSTTPGQVKIPSNLPDLPVETVIVNVINWGLSAAGGVATLMLVVGGFLYLTAAGDERRIERGKATIRSSITGIIIILVSAIIVNTINAALF